jgi:hypothetical protein
VSAHLLVHCDGTRDDRPDMALGRCRAFVVVDAFLQLPALGWRESYVVADELAHRRDLCPGCAKGSTS